MPHEMTVPANMNPFRIGQFEAVGEDVTGAVLVTANGLQRGEHPVWAPYDGDATLARWMKLEVASDAMHDGLFFRYPRGSPVW